MRRRLLQLLLVLLVATLAAGGWALTSEAALRWTFARLAPLAGGELQVEALQGRLLGPITARNVRYQSDALRLEIARLELDWRILRLLTGNLVITRLLIEQPRLHLPAATAPAAVADDLPDWFFPLSLTLRQGRVDRIAILREDAAPLLLHTVELEAQAALGSVRLHRLLVESEGFQFIVSGDLQPRGQYPLAMETQWSATLPGYGPLAGRGRLDGDLRRLVIRQQLLHPVAIELEATLENVLSDRRWKARSSATAIEAQRINPSWPALRFGWQAEGGGTFQAFQLRSTLHLTGWLPWPVDGRVVVDHDTDLWQLTELVLTTDQPGMRLSAQGDWHTDTASFDVKGDWQQLRWIGPDATGWISPRGRWQASGKPDAYRLSLNAGLSGSYWPSSQWWVDGRGDRQSLTLASLRGKWLDGDIQAQGRLVWQPTLQWRTSVQAAQLNPGSAWPQWPGRLNLAATSRGAIENGEFAGSVTITALDGTLRGRPVQGAGTVTRQGQNYEIDALTLSSGKASANLHGRRAQAWDLRWQVTADELADAWPQLHGKLRSQGRLQGALAQPRLTGTLTASALSSPAVKVASAQGDVDMDLSGQQPLQLRLQADQMQIAALRLDALSVTGQGQHGQQDVTVEIKADQQHARLLAQGKLQAGRWLGHLQHMTLTTQDKGRWDLLAPGPLEISAEAIRLGQWCLTDDGARLCGQLAWQPRNKALNVAFSAGQLPLAMLQPLMPADLAMDGLLEADVEARWLQGQLHQAQGIVSLSPGRLSYPIRANQRGQLGYRRGVLQADLVQQRLTGRVDLALSDNQYLLGQWSLPYPLESGGRTQSVSGQIKARLRQLDLLTALVPGVQGPEGELDMDFSWQGTLAAPQLRGQAALRRASFGLPDLGIRLTQAQFRIAGQGSDSVKLEAEANSGNGTLAAHGSMRLDPVAGWPGTLSLTGRHFEAIKLPEAWVTVSPSMNLDVRQHRIGIQGALHIPEATLSPRELTASIPLSRDVVMVGNGGTAAVAPSGPWEITTRLQLSLGDKVKFNGFGLSGQLTGELVAVDAPGKLTTATGKLAIVEGKYRAYGQKLEVNPGQLIFTGGPIDDPGLDARAVRRSGDVLAGIKVRGTLKYPEMTLFSEPAMPDADALSYLLLGRPASQASQGDAQLLLAAASTLQLTDGEALAGRIATRFGLEQVSLETSTASGEGASLVLGKYLAPRLYVSYTLGLFEPVNTVRARYELNRKWMLQGESSTEQSGGDLLYSIEP